MVLRQRFAVPVCPLCLPTRRQRLVSKVVLLTLRPHLHVLPGVDVLETGDVPIRFSFPQVKNWGTTVELDPTGDTLTCPAFGLCPFSADCSTMDHLVLDFTSHA